MTPQHRISPIQTQHARRLRKAMTDAEQRLWSVLRERQINGCKFRRQHPIGPYIADFVCLDAALIVEVDGGQHAKLVEQDRQRSLWLEQHGFRVLRFWNHEILQQMDAVQEQIALALSAVFNPHPGLPPDGGRDVFKQRSNTDI